MAIFALVFTMTFAARAHDPTPSMTVWSRGSNDYLRAKYPHERIEYIDQGSVAADYAEEGYLPPHARDAVFERLHLTKALAKVDELDKDMLVMSVRDADLPLMKRLAAKYPMLSMAQLQRLKAAVGRAK